MAKCFCKVTYFFAESVAFFDFLYKRTKVSHDKAFHKGCDLFFLGKTEWKDENNAHFGLFEQGERGREIDF